MAFALAGSCAIAGPALGLNVGYYDMGAGQGVSSQVAPINTAGQTPVLMTDLSAADLVGIDILFVQNPDNGGYGAEYLTRLADIDAAVNAGMVLIIHDRYVDGAEGILPGGGAFDIRRDFADGSNINVLNSSTVVTNGPGGIIDDSSLDGGNFSSHGYAVASSLPGNAILVLTRGNPAEIVTFAYRYGAGFVIYSTIPLDYYLAGGGGNFAPVYAPNVVAFGPQLLLCGNGTIESGEQCDDGNSTTGDGCGSTCQFEPCYTCTGEPSMCFSLPDGSDCSDGLFCNGTDTCASAACSVHTGDPCTGGVECNNVCNEVTNSCALTAGTPCTDDANTCTDDQCDGLGACMHPPNFNSCDDGLFCDGQDYCSGGSCVGHYGDPCMFAPECANVCDELNDVCGPTASGIACSDDANVCTNDRCDGAGACGHPPTSNGTPCADDGNECTNDQCDGAGACGHPAVANGTPCDDDDACTQTDKCQAGQCAGSNPIICAAALCHQPGTCDPGSGACSSCPAGYSPGGGGCRKAYAIDATRLDNQANDCGTGGRYNSCNGLPFGFHWTDTGDASVGAVTRVDVQLEAGIDCSGSDHSVTLNATSIGTYTSTNSCSCPAAHAPRLLADVDTSTYVKGGANAVSIGAFGCDGLSQDSDGSYAVVTVTYQDPGYALEIRNDCRQALKSKFKYKKTASGAKDKLKWKWGKGDATTQGEFGDPTATADYQLCVFAETSGSATLLIGADVPASSTLWSAVGSTGYKYNDSAAGQDGISGTLLRAGADGKAKLLVKGKGAGLSDPTLPLAPGTSGVRVQLSNDSSGLCWESEFPISAVTANEGGIKAKMP